MARVVLDHLNKTFPARGGKVIRAVKDLSLAIEPGELIVLLGPSGCGKTTTLRLIAGLEQATSGAISIDRRDVTQMDAKDREVAMVFQHHALYPHMNVRENLAFGLKLRKVPRAETETRVREAVEMLGLDGSLDRMPAELSGGQKQRVALGRALARKPRLLLLDEPLSNLDAQLRAQLRSDIARLHRTLGCTMIYVTHDQTEAMMLGTRLAVMKEGTLQQTGEPLEIYRKPRNIFVAGFIGWPAMNLIHGALLKKESGLYFEASPGSPGGSRFGVVLSGLQASGLERLAGKEVVFGIRPENIRNGSSENKAVMETVVQLIEPVGADTYLHLAIGGARFVARTAGDEQFGLNQKRLVTFDPAFVHLFDAATGDAIR